MIKKVLLLILCCIGLLIVFIIYNNEITRIFKQSIHINYQEDIVYIEVSFYGYQAINNEGYTKIKIEDRSDIKRIINYINSLELIEEFPRVEYFPDPNENETIDITVFRSGYTEDDTKIDGFLFQNKYMSFTPKCFDWESRIYYIKDSKYNSITKNSKTYEFLYDYLNKYVESIKQE